MMCLGLVFFMFPVFGFQQGSRIYEFIVFVKFGKFLAIISSNNFFCSSSLLSFGNLVTHKLGCSELYHNCWSFHCGWFLPLRFVFDSFHPYDFIFSNLFFCKSDLLLIPYNIYFISGTVVFSLASIWFSCIHSMSLTVFLNILFLPILISVSGLHQCW